MNLSRIASSLRSFVPASALLLAVNLPCAASSPGGGKDVTIDFDALYASFSAAHCDKSGACEFEAVLQRDFLELRLGAFDLRYPRAELTGLGEAKDYTDLAAGLVQMQARLVDWLGLASEQDAAMQADFASLAAWIGTWQPSDLARAAKADSASLLEGLGAPEEVCAAALRLGAALVDRELLGLAPQYVENVRLVISPRRREFMEWIGFMGRGDKEWASQHWVEGADQWTQFWYGPTMFLALEYAPWSGFDAEFRTGLPPEKLDRDGRRQHVLNQSARALLFRLFNRPEFAPLERALAALLVIDVSGGIVVLDGEGGIKTSGGTTAPYSRFVPGGLSQGGVLPAAPAGGLDQIVNSRWRAGKGSDFFVQALRDGQKDGTKLAAKERDNPRRKDGLVNFAIDSELSGEKWVAHAPFLGPHAAEQAYPASEFLTDYGEFFKSYQTAFYHWLATEASAELKPAGAPFGEFLRGLSTPEYLGQPGDVLETAFGLPLSGRDGSTDSLEWRFLAWLAAQKK